MKTKQKYSLLAAISVVLIGGWFLGGVSIIHAASTANPPLTPEERTEIATSDSNPAVRSAALANLQAQALTIRSKWQPWALAHESLLEYMLHSNDNSRTILTTVLHAIPTYPHAEDPADNAGIPDSQINSQLGTFTWQSLEKDNVAFNPNEPKYNDSPAMRDAMLRNFSLHHDIVISESVNTGPVHIYLWASGHITIVQLISTRQGHHMPILTRWQEIKQIAPAYDFLTQNNSR